MLDLEGLAGTYRLEAEVSPRARRWLVVGCASWIVAVVAVLTVRALTAGRHGLADASWTVLPSAVLWPILWIPALRTPFTRIDAEALTCRNGIFTRRTTAWSDVTAIHLPGRWDDHSSVVLAHGGRLALPGLPLEKAVQLADVVAGLPPGTTAAARAVPARVAPRAVDVQPSGVQPTDADMDGPFRRGRSRRP